MLYQAIEGKNRKEAKKIMRLHFKDILNHLKDTFKKGGKSNG
jgi:DNA-binding GntR family transcriptional regulator